MRQANCGPLHRHAGQVGTPHARAGSPSCCRAEDVSPTVATGHGSIPVMRRRASCRHTPATVWYAWVQAGVEQLASCSYSCARSRSKSRRVSPLVCARVRALSASVVKYLACRSAPAPAVVVGQKGCAGVIVTSYSTRAVRVARFSQYCLCPCLLVKPIRGGQQRGGLR
jgi:hypothetical protein